MSFFKKKSFESIQNPSKSQLNKNLTAFDVILLGLGSIVGTGVFVLTGFVSSQYAGPAIIISYAIAGFACIFIALAYTELVSMLPTSGSIYSYSYVVFGEVVAWLVSSIIIIELSFAASAVSISWSAYVQGILESAGMALPSMIVNSPAEGGIINLPALFIVCLIGFMLYRGTQESKRINNVLVIIKLIAIFLFIFFAAPHFDITNWKVFIPYGVDDVLYGSSILFFAYTGFGTLATAAEECKEPKKSLTIGIIGSLVIAIIIYLLVSVTLTGIVHYTELNNSQPLAYALKQNGNSLGSALVATGAVAGMTTVILVNIYGQSRIFYVIARDGLLPKPLMKLHDKYHSPYITILIFTLIVGLMGAFLPCNILAQLSSMGALTDYIIVTIIVLIFRIKKPDIERPFKCPAIFLIVPVALVSATYLLFKQIIGKNGELLFTGKVFISWFIIVFILYTVQYYIRRVKNTN